MAHVPPPPAAGASRGKRKQVVVACDRCRSRKTKCDGQRPACTPCSSRRLECRWSAEPDANPMTALKRKNDTLADDIIQYRRFTILLCESSDAEAQRIITSLRQGTDVATIVEAADSQAEDGDTGVPDASPSENASHASASSSRRLSHARLASEPLLHPERVALSTTTPPAKRPRLLARAPDFTFRDSRLERISAAHWGVRYVGGDEYFRRLLQSFFTWDHPSLALFDKDILLDDLVAGSVTEFCCPIILHAIVLLSTRSYNTIDPANTDVIEHFAVHYIKRLWDIQQNKSKPATIISGIALFLFHSWRGQDTHGYQYLAQAFFTSDVMGLYRPLMQNETYSEATELRRRTSGLAAIAWGQYNFRAYISLLHDIQPILVAPPVSIPARRNSVDGENLTDGDRELWMPWPFNDYPRPSLADSLLHSRSELSKIVVNIMSLHQRFENEPITETYLDGAKHLFYQAEAWMKRLSPSLKEESELENGSPQLLALHDYYNLTNAELFRPFVVTPDRLSPSPAQLLGAGLPAETALPAYMEAYQSMVDNMLRFERQYLPQCPMPPQNIATTTHICIDLMPQLAHNDSARQLFTLTLSLCQRMAKSYSIYRLVIRALCFIAHSHDYELPPSAKAIFAQVDDDYPVIGNLEPVRSTYIVKASMKFRDGHDATLETITEKMKDLRAAT